MDIYNVISDVLMRQGCDGLYVGANIPKHKLDNAIAHYPMSPKTRVIGLIDCTVMGSCKNGLAITDAGFIWKNMWAIQSPKTNLSWAELIEIQDDIAIDGNDILFGPYGRFGLAGSNMSPTEGFHLFHAIADCILEAVENYDDTDDIEIEEKVIAIEPITSDTTLYCELIPELIALCMSADGSIEDDEVELASAFIESDELITDKPKALESLSVNMERMLADREKSKAIFKMKTSSIIAKVVNITNQLQKDKINIILEGMLEAASEDEGSDTNSVVETIKSKMV